MASFRKMKNSFVSGELSPRLEGRSDLVQYAQGMRQCENMTVLPHGGVTARSGTHFTAEVKTSSKLTILAPFIYSTTEAYVIEIGDIYMRFFSDEAVVGAPTEISTPYLEAELRDLMWAQEANIMYFIHPNHPLYRLDRTSATTFTLTKVAFRDGKAPLKKNNVGVITITQSGGGPSFTLTASAPLFVVADDVGRALRLSDSGANTAFYELDAVSSTTVATGLLKSGLAPAGAQADWALGMQSDNEGFRGITFHEGRLALGGTTGVPDRWSLSNSDDFEFFGDDASLDDNAIYRRVSSTSSNSIQWGVSIADRFTVGTAGGEFTMVGVNDAILTPGATRVSPQTKRGSMHLPPIEIGDSLFYMQNDSRVMRRLQFDADFKGLRAAYANILAEHIFKAGGAIQMAYQQSPDSVVWIVRGDGQLIGITIELEQDIIAGHRHVLGGSFNTQIAQVESVAVMPNPEGTQDQLWLITKRTIDGVTKRYVEFMEDQFDPELTPASTTQERANAMKLAHFWDSNLELTNEVAISAITQANPGVITSAGAHGLLDGEQVFLDELLGMELLNDIAYEVDGVSGLDFTLKDLDTGVAVDTTTFAPYISGGFSREMVNTVSGLAHLEGETVSVLTDGSQHPDRVVASGAISLARLSARVVVGLTYKGKVETQRLVGEDSRGAQEGLKGRVSHAVVRVDNSLGGRFASGSQPETTDPLILREGSWPMNQAAPVVTGDRVVDLDQGPSREPTAYFEQTPGLPLTVLSFTAYVETEE